MVARRLRLLKPTNKLLVPARGIFTLSGQAVTLTKGGGSYPAVVTSLGIEDAYDLPGNVGCRIAEGSLKDPVTDSGLLPAGATVDATTHKRIILGGAYSGTRRTFSGWNLKDRALYIEIQAAGWTVEDNYVGPSGSNGVALNTNNFAIKTTNAAASHTPGDDNSNVIIQWNSVTGYDEGTDAYYNACHIGSSVNVSGVKVLRNHLYLSAADNIKPRGDDWLVEYNHGTVGGVGSPAAHYDFLQILNGARLIVRRNFIDMTPLIGTPQSYGRTNAVRLEAFASTDVVSDAVIERNYILGADVLDYNGQPEEAIFCSTGPDGGGAGVVSNNQFNYNAVGIRASLPFNAIIHPTGESATGTGNRNIADNTVIADFTLP